MNENEHENEVATAETKDTSYLDAFDLSFSMDEVFDTNYFNY